MKLEKETSIYQLGAISADIGAAVTLAKGKNKIFYQDTAPATGMNVGDLWFKVDSSGGSSLYEYKKTGSNPDTYAWTLRQLGQGSLLANSVTANEINVNALSAISAYLGNVIVGGNNNEDGSIVVNNAQGAEIGHWNNTGILASAGTIGPWTIGANGIYNGKSAYANGVNGTYIGTNGIEIETNYGWTRQDPTNGIKIHSKDHNYDFGLTVSDSFGSTFVYSNGYQCFSADSDCAAEMGLNSGTIGFIDLTDFSTNGHEGYINLDAENPTLTFGYGTAPSINYLNYNANCSMIRFKGASNAYGHGISIGGGGRTVIGGGEAASTIEGQTTDWGDEAMIVAGDGAIDFYSNCQNGFSSAYQMQFNGNLYIGRTTDTTEFQITARNSYSNVCILAGSSNHGLWTNTKSGWIIRVPNSSSDSAAYIPRDLTIDGGNGVAQKSSANVWLWARQSQTGNGIWIQSNSSGTVELGSRGANGTSYPILSRANNSNAITGYGTWTMNLVPWKTDVSGRAVISDESSSKQVAILSSGGSGELTVTGKFSGSSWVTAIYRGSASDIRWKENVEDTTITALPLINSIRMRQFDWKQDKRHQAIGFIADELEELDEKLSVGGGYDENGTMNVKSVDTFYLLGYLVKAVQELSAWNDDLLFHIKENNFRIVELEREVKKLKGAA